MLSIRNERLERRRRLNSDTICVLLSAGSEWGVIEPDHFGAPLKPAAMTKPPTTGDVGRSRGSVSSASGITTH